MPTSVTSVSDFSPMINLTAHSPRPAAVDSWGGSERERWKRQHIICNMPRHVFRGQVGTDSSEPKSPPKVRSARFAPSIAGGTRRVRERIQISSVSGLREKAGSGKELLPVDEAVVKCDF